MSDTHDLYAQLAYAESSAVQAEKEAIRHWVDAVEWNRLLVEKLSEGPEREGSKILLLRAEKRLKRLRGLGREASMILDANVRDVR